MSAAQGNVNVLVFPRLKGLLEVLEKALEEMQILAGGRSAGMSHSSEVKGDNRLGTNNTVIIPRAFLQQSVIATFTLSNLYLS